MFKPFSPTVWICIVLTIALTSILLRIAFSCESEINESVRVLKRNREAVVILSLGAFFLQGNGISFRLMSGRYLTIIMLVCSILIHDFYTSVMVSSLVESAPKATFTNLRDLADSALSFGFFNVSHSLNFLEVFSKCND